MNRDQIAAIVREAETRAARAEAAEAEGERRRKEMAVEITGLRRSYTDAKGKATRAEAHAERLAAALDGVIAVADRNTPEFREARQALSAYRGVNDE